MRFDRYTKIALAAVAVWALAGLLRERAWRSGFDSGYFRAERLFDWLAVRSDRWGAGDGGTH
jgi:hypothetical protein